MNGNCHFIYAGAVTGMLALNIDKLPLGMENNSTTAALLILGGLIGGIFPDIDNPNSYMGKLSVPVSTCIAKISEGFGKKEKSPWNLSRPFHLYFRTCFILSFYETTYRLIYRMPDTCILGYV